MKKFICSVVSISLISLCTQYLTGVSEYQTSLTAFNDFEKAKFAIDKRLGNQINNLKGQIRALKNKAANETDLQNKHEIRQEIQNIITEVNRLDSERTKVSNEQFPG